MLSVLSFLVFLSFPLFLPFKQVSRVTERQESVGTCLKHRTSYQGWNVDRIEKSPVVY